jgi:hypothetical protein
MKTKREEKSMECMYRRKEGRRYSRVLIFFYLSQLSQRIFQLRVFLLIPKRQERKGSQVNSPAYLGYFLKRGNEKIAH